MVMCRYEKMALTRKSLISVYIFFYYYYFAERWDHVAEGLFQLYKNAPITLRPPAHCSSPEIAFAERCPQINMTEKETMPEAMNPFLAFNKGKYFSKV